MNYRQAIAEIRMTREASLVRADLKYEKALERDPELYSMELDKRDLILRAAHGEDTAARIKETDDKILQYLKQHYGSLEEFFPPYSCEKCKDTGIANGKICDCAIKLAVSQSDNIELPLNDFKDGLEGAPEELKRTYEHMRVFCDKFPDTNIKNIVLMGGSGTGKTFLMGCIAKELALRCSLMFLTAYGFNKRLTAYHTTFDDTKEGYLEPILDSDVLIIDDLGSESMLRNVTKEYLYIVINERNLKGKATLVTTNLDMKALEERYGAKTVSRLFDKNVCYAKVLKGYDLRKI